MNLKFILPLFACFFLIGSTIQAQDNSPKNNKTIIIKTIEENGTESTETIEIDSDELQQDGAVKILKFSNEAEDAENVDVDVEVINGEKVITVKVDGTEKVIQVPQGEHTTGQHRMILIEEEDAQGEQVIEIIESDHSTPSNAVMPGLEDINQDDIKNIDVAQNNGMTEVTIELKDGKVIKRKIVEKHHRNAEARPFLGIELQHVVTKIDEGDGAIEINSSANGIVVDAVIANSAAEKAGIQKGDIIKSIDGQSLAEFKDLTNFMRSKKVGDKISVNLDRMGKAMQIDAILGTNNRRHANNTIRKQHFKHNGHRDHNNWSKRTPIKRDPCKPFIGFYNRTNPDIAVKVTKIIPNTPADRHGLQVGDVILEMDGIAIESHKQLLGIRDAHDAGDRFKLMIDRDGKKMKIKGHFNDCPKDQAVEAIPEINNSIELDSQIETSFQAFPNPSQGLVNIKYQGTPGKINIKVSDISGKVILEKSIANFDGFYQEEYDFSQTAEGTLIFQIENDGEVTVEKLILQNKD